MNLGIFKNNQKKNWYNLLAKLTNNQTYKTIKQTETID